MKTVSVVKDMSTTNQSNGAATGGQSNGTASGGENSSQDSTFECNICLDTAKDAVVSLCGHLFCWPCLHRWLETRPNRPVCPVCKAAINRDRVVPLYGRGGSREDPRDRLPPRPRARRTEPELSASQQQQLPGFSFGDGGFHMSFGIGAFPFGIFASSFNFGDGRPAPTPGTPEYDDDQFFSKLFLWVAIGFLIWLFFA